MIYFDIFEDKPQEFLMDEDYSYINSFYLSNETENKKYEQILYETFKEKERSPYSDLEEVPLYETFQIKDRNFNEGFTDDIEINITEGANTESALFNTENQNTTNGSTLSLHFDIPKEEQKKNTNQLQSQTSDLISKEMKVEGKINEQNEEENLIILVNEKLKLNEELKGYTNRNTNLSQKGMIATRKQLFKVEKKKFLLNNLRKGRVSKKRKNEVWTLGKYHSRFIQDNIFRKIKVIYHSFLLKFVNNFIEILNHSQSTKIKIQKINSEITQNVSIEFNKKLFNEKLWEFFSKKTSKKYKTKGNNREILLDIMEKDQSISKVLEMSYIDVYNELFVNANSDILPKEFEAVLTNSPHLSKVIQNMEMKDSKYTKEFDFCARKKFQSYFNTKKPRKPRKIKPNNSSVI